MVFWFFKRKTKPAPGAERPDEDPIAVYDRVIAGLEKQSAMVRQSAATLLAVREKLSADHTRYTGSVAALKERLTQAFEKNDAGSITVLEGDIKRQESLLVSTEAAMETANADATELLSVARRLAEEQHELSLERTNAQLRTVAGSALSKALSHRDEFDRQMSVDRARDDVERAHALAELYREEERDRASKRGPIR